LIQSDTQFKELTNGEFPVCKPGQFPEAAEGKGHVRVDW